MDKNTISMTVRGEGRVRLEDWAATVTNFAKLIDAVAEEAAPGVVIEWRVVGLDLTDNAATITVKAVTPESEVTP